MKMKLKVRCTHILNLKCDALCYYQATTCTHTLIHA